MFKRSVLAAAIAFVSFSQLAIGQTETSENEEVVLEGNGVAIRGFTDVTTTINGRQIFTSSGRQVALADVPAALISGGVDIYKTRSAEQISSGMAGQINIHKSRIVGRLTQESSVLFG